MLKINPEKSTQATLPRSAAHTPSNLDPTEAPLCPALSTVYLYILLEFGHIAHSYRDPHSPRTKATASVGCCCSPVPEPSCLSLIATWESQGAALGQKGCSDEQACAKQSLSTAATAHRTVLSSRGRSQTGCGPRCLRGHCYEYLSSCTNNLVVTFRHGLSHPLIQNGEHAHELDSPVCD